MNIWTVHVPDRTQAFTFDKSLVRTVEEVRQALIANGISSVANATATQEGNTISFRRPTGGSKGGL